MQHLNKLDETAKKIGAVNTIKFTKRGDLKGYNTDVYGFEISLRKLSLTICFIFMRVKFSKN